MPVLRELGELVVWYLWLVRYRADAVVTVGCYACHEGAEWVLDQLLCLEDSRDMLHTFHSHISWNWNQSRTEISSSKVCIRVKSLKDNRLVGGMRGVQKY